MHFLAHFDKANAPACASITQAGAFVASQASQSLRRSYRWVLAFPAVVSVYHTFCFLRVKAENPASLYDKLAGHSALC